MYHRRGGGVFNGQRIEPFDVIRECGRKPLSVQTEDTRGYAKGFFVLKHPAG